MPWQQAHSHHCISLSKLQKSLKQVLLRTYAGTNRKALLLVLPVRSLDSSTIDIYIRTACVPSIWIGYPAMPFKTARIRFGWTASMTTVSKPKSMFQCNIYFCNIHTHCMHDYARTCRARAYIHTFVRMYVKSHARCLRTYVYRSMPPMPPLARIAD